MSTEETIIENIRNHMKSRGGAHSEWYVGIATEFMQRLFQDHNVNPKNDFWIYQYAGSRSAAEKIEHYFINTLGTKGGPGGDDENTKFVYAYRVRPHTRQ